MLENFKQLTLRINVNTFWMLLLVVLVDAERLAVTVLVLQNVRILLAFQPRVLQVEQNGLFNASVQEVVHLLASFKMSKVEKAAWRACFCVLIRRPLMVRNIFVCEGLALAIGGLVVLRVAAVFVVVIIVVLLRLCVAHFKLDFNIVLL